MDASERCQQLSKENQDRGFELRSEITILSITVRALLLQARILGKVQIDRDAIIHDFVTIYPNVHIASRRRNL